jgi:hypothetical protein
MWGLYRTGGIIKIRLDNSSPIIYLNGNSILNLQYGSPYTDPGVTVSDNSDINLIPYITFFLTGASNLITDPIPITGPTTISTISNLDIGTYNITYSVTDSSGNIGLNYRTLNIIS